MTLLSIKFIYLFILHYWKVHIQHTEQSVNQSFSPTLKKNQKSMSLTIDQYQKVNTPV